jgi:sulfate permease, SulP family
MKERRICMKGSWKEFFFRIMPKDLFASSAFTDLKSYKLATFQSDFLAALSVALLTIPQSIAYSLLAGLPPSAGLFSAIFGTIFTGALGSSKHLVSGPSTGVSILIQSVISDTMASFCPEVMGPEKNFLALTILTHIVLMIGLIQILAALFHLGKVLQFVSHSVVLGYFFGVVLAVVINQLFHFTGIRSPDGVHNALYKAFYLFRHLFSLHWEITLLGLLSVFLLFFLEKYFRKLPCPLIMLLSMGSLGYLMNGFFASFMKERRFHIPNLGDLGFSEVPKIILRLPLLDWNLLTLLLPATMAIALLSILEVFSVSKGLGSKSGQQIQNNQEIFSIGTANAVLSFFSGAMPASGSLSRSTVNFIHGGKTRFSAILSSLLTLLLIFFAWPFVKHIAVCSLAALVMFIAPSVVDRKQMKLSFQATKGDGFVFVVTATSCLIFSLEVAFFLGIILSIASFISKIATPLLVEYAFNSSGRLMVIETGKVHRKIRIIGIGGELFFAAVDFFQHALNEVAKDPFVKAIVLRLNGVHYMDASMCLALMRLEEFLQATHRHLIISGITEEVWATLKRAGLIEQIGKDNVFLTNETNPQLSTWKAWMRAEELLP